MPYISNKKQVILVEEGQLEAFLSQEENGKPIWVEVDPPQMSRDVVAEQVAQRGEGTVALRHGNSVAYANEDQVEAMTAGGWKRITEEEAEKLVQRESVPEKPADPPPAETGLRAVLAGLDPADDTLWNGDGQVNIGALKALDPAATREAVNEVWPDFNRSVLSAAE